MSLIKSFKYYHNNIKRDFNYDFTKNKYNEILEYIENKNIEIKNIDEYFNINSVL